MNRAANHRVVSKPAGEPVGLLAGLPGKLMIGLLVKVVNELCQILIFERLFFLYYPTLLIIFPLLDDT